MRRLSIFQTALIISLLSVFIYLLLSPAHEKSSSKSVAIKSNVLYIFYHLECIHCRNSIDFFKKQSIKNIQIEYFDITSITGKQKLGDIISQSKFNIQQLGVPLFVYNNEYRIGFDNPETTGKELILWLTSPQQQIKSDESLGNISVPIIGKIKPEKYSLPVLTIILSLVDGFNPCAMWVLVYLISVIISLNDRSKVWWLVGSFVFASGVSYFLFMTAWLNLFLFIGYIKILTWLIGLTAIGMGINQLYLLIQSHGAVTCEVGTAERHKKTMSKIRKVVSAPMNLVGFGAIIGLAFAVNAIEFVCSAAIPAIYTHTLTLIKISTLSYYLYILLYVFFYMLDDLIIFGLAAFAVQKVVNTQYVVYSRIIGGITLTVLGLWMLIGFVK